MLKEFLKCILEPVRKNGILSSANAMAKGRVSERKIEEITVRWLITNRNDEIQNGQIKNGFYERDELMQLRRDIGVRKSVLDVGANIGNHSVFFAKFMGCRTLVCVEPFFEAYTHLLANLALNTTPGFDVRVVSAALGRDMGTARIVAPTKFNIGLTRVDVSGSGDVAVATVDEVVGDRPLDLVKIDVEGMEVDVLSGMSSVLMHQRPAVYVEVSDESLGAACSILENRRYALVRKSKAYDSQFNLTFVPE